MQQPRTRLKKITAQKIVARLVADKAELKCAEAAIHDVVRDFMVSRDAVRRLARKDRRLTAWLSCKNVKKRRGRPAKHDKNLLEALSQACRDSAPHRRIGSNMFKRLEADAVRLGELGCGSGSIVRQLAREWRVDPLRLYFRLSTCGALGSAAPSSAS